MNKYIFWGPPAPPWATAAAMGPGGEGGEGDGVEGNSEGGIDWVGDTSGYYIKPNRLYKAPTDNTELRQTIQRPEILDKPSGY